MTSADLGIALLWIATLIFALNAAAMAVILKRQIVDWYWSWRLKRVLARPYAEVDQPLIRLVRKEMQER